MEPILFPRIAAGPRIPATALCLLLALFLAGCAGRGTIEPAGLPEPELPPPSQARPHLDQTSRLPGPTISHPPLDTHLPREAELPRETGLPARPAPSETAKLPPIKDPRIPETWHPLLGRLAADGLDGDDLRRTFAAFGDTYSPKPMGDKIKELFTYKYLRTPPAPGRRATPSARVYPGFVIPERIAECRWYLEANAPYFAIGSERYGVPEEIAVSLLMVETKLGNYLGAQNAFWSLACMAAADSPERIAEPLELLPVTPDRLAWVKTKLTERSAWAYKELKALLAHIREHKLDPLNMPGSVYGAIGLCQFMPSNLKPYGVDGDQDGKIDLFDPADAIPSVGNYLKGHGWKRAMTRTQQHAVLKRYNNSNVYANTILAIAEAIAASRAQAVR